MLTVTVASVHVARLYGCAASPLPPRPHTPVGMTPKLVALAAGHCKAPKKVAVIPVVGGVYEPVTHRFDDAGTRGPEPGVHVLNETSTTELGGDAGMVQAASVKRNCDGVAVLVAPHASNPHRLALTLVQPTDDAVVERGPVQSVLPP